MCFGIRSAMFLQIASLISSSDSFSAKIWLSTGKNTASVTPSFLASSFEISTHFVISTAMLDSTFTLFVVIVPSLFLKSTFKKTAGTAASWIACAVSLSSLSPACAMTLPCVSTTSSARICPESLLLKESFLLNLYLPTFARSYLLGSKNIPEISASALSTDNGSPGLNFL